MSGIRPNQRPWLADHVIFLCYRWLSWAAAALPLFWLDLPAAYGWALLEGILSAEECRAIAALYDESGIFRKQIVMARHGFGSGEYKYYDYPLPHIISELRTQLYPRLAPIADRLTRRDLNGPFDGRCEDNRVSVGGGPVRASLILFPPLSQAEPPPR